MSFLSDNSFTLLCGSFLYKSIIIIKRFATRYIHSDTGLLLPLFFILTIILSTFVQQQYACMYVCCESVLVCIIHTFISSFPFCSFGFYKINFVLLSPFVDFILLCDLNTNKTSSACKARIEALICAKERNAEKKPMNQMKKQKKRTTTTY